MARWMREGGWLQLHGGATIHVHNTDYNKIRLWVRTQEDFDELNKLQPATLKKLFLAQAEPRPHKWQARPPKNSFTAKP